MKPTEPEKPVRGVMAAPPRATKSAALLLASALAVPAFVILNLVEVGLR